MDTGTPDHPRYVTLTVTCPTTVVPGRPIEVRTHDDGDRECAPRRYYTTREALALAHALDAGVAAAVSGGTYLGVLSADRTTP